MSNCKLPRVDFNEVLQYDVFIYYNCYFICVYKKYHSVLQIIIVNCNAIVCDMVLEKNVMF